MRTRDNRKVRLPKIPNLDYLFPRGDSYLEELQEVERIEQELREQSRKRKKY